MTHLLFVVGTTATGKSDLAVEIVEDAIRSRATPALAPEIINSDSVSFFDKVQIGAAKPGPELLARAKHHLIGHVAPPHKYTAGDFRRDALAIIEKPNAYLVAGGSGFYVQALEKGMYDVGEPDPGIKERIAQDAAEHGPAALYEELKAKDPTTKIQPADHYRVHRALEILRANPGKTMAEIKAEFEAARPVQPFTSKKIGLFRSREVLRQKVTERTRAMIERGLIEEVESLRREGLHAWSPMQSVGYKEVQLYLDGQMKRDELEPAIVTSTMQLAKQQMTWFRRDPNTHWFDPDTQWKEALEAGAQLLTPP
jgi:tRNA dimethylallyltransferase